MRTCIYVLHEYGAPSHYIALKTLAQRHGIRIKFREFNLYRQLKHCIKNPINIDRWKKLFINLYFLLTIPYIYRKTKIVLGIAPFNSSLKPLMKCLKKHDVYYHTSYTHWDGSTAAHIPKNEKDMDIWREFTNHYVKHIFAVTQKTKQELVNNNFSVSNSISVVNHSYSESLTVQEKKEGDLSFICCAVLEPHKGIEQLLKYFSLHSECTLTIVGRGQLKEMVEKYVERYSNIHYLGYIKGFKKLVLHYTKSSYILLNSQKTSSWEELFGMVLIEGMACGCVPICTDHSGPLEIVIDHVNGIVCREGEIEKGIEEVIAFNQQTYNKYRKAAIEKGKKYHCEQIANYWKRVLN